MSAILQYYFDIFVPSYEFSPDMVDISDLIEQGKYLSPVQLHYSDKDASLKNLGAAIVMNICKSYQETKMLPKKCIEILTKIIGKSMDSPDIAAQEIFLVHISKRSMDVDLFAYLIIMTETMRVKPLLSESETQWVELAKKVTRHKEINECIADLAQVPQRVDEREDIKITIVEGNTSYLRGFVGFEEILIHADSLQEKIDGFRSDDVDLLQLVTKMDIISITLHELAHLKLRKYIGDFNSPILAATSGVDVNEFGVYVERKIFKKQVDWFKSTKTVDMGYVKRFITAIENQSQLPAGYIKGAVPRSGMPGVGGSDLQLTSCIC